MDITFDRNNRLIAGVTTLLFTALVLCLLFLVKLWTPIPPFEERGGIEVILGVDDQGTGSDVAPPPASEKTNQVHETVTKTQAATQQQVMTSEDPENVSVHTVKSTQQAPVVDEPRPDPALVALKDKPISKATGTGTGHGDDKVPGWEGDPNGDPNSKVYSKGKGGKDGETWVIGGSGRKMIGDVAIYDDSQETGIVAVDITVDKYGKIIKAEPVLIGSTTTSSVLWKKAKDGLINKVLFNQSATGEEARGTIYINFTVR